MTGIAFFLFAAGAEIKIGVIKKRLTAESAENAENKNEEYGFPLSRE